MTETNVNARLETFCDGVFAIALTLLIIDIKIHSVVPIHNTADFWIALKHVAPSILAFVLSFVIILITWVNHHNTFKLLNKSSSGFIYANGLLLLSIVFIPFPTSLMGEHLFTGHSAPAVVLYSAVLVLQALGWILLTSVALNNNLCKNEKSILFIRKNRMFGYFAFALYSLCAIIAFWLPLTIAIITAATWIFWLIHGINIKEEQTK